MHCRKHIKFLSVIDIFIIYAMFICLHALELWKIECKVDVGLVTVKVDRKEGLTTYNVQCTSYLTKRKKIEFIKNSVCMYICVCSFPVSNFGYFMA